MRRPELTMAAGDATGGCRGIYVEGEARAAARGRRMGAGRRAAKAAR